MAEKAEAVAADDSVEVALELAQDIGAHLKEFERRSLDL